MKTGYSIKTWKMRLFCPEKQMIETTEALYREAVAFYYELLKEREELWAENLLTIQGHLEKLTVPGRDGREPKYIPPGGKLPVYFRRSAMNKAAMAVKTAASAESFPEKIDANITFFKGMYKDLTDTSVVLKLWNGKKWIWVLCGLTGRPFPKEAAILSPTLVHEEKWLMFHVPVKQENSDARTAKERMQEGARVCSVRFTNTDSFAVCTVLDEGSRQLAVKNCRGGNAYRHHCKALLKKVEASRAFTDKDNVSQPNRKYYMHLKHLNEHYAHQVSKEIMDFCSRKLKLGILLLGVLGGALILQSSVFDKYMQIDKIEGGGSITGRLAMYAYYFNGFMQHRVWFGCKCIVLKGSEILRDTVIAAGSIVSGKQTVHS